MGADTFIYHVWPNVAPTATFETVFKSTVEDRSTVIKIGDIGYEHNADILVAEIITLPAHGKLFQMATGEVYNITDAATEITNAGDLTTHPWQSVVYVPDDNSFGDEFDEYTVKFKSTASGLYSPLITIKIAVESVDDKPGTDGGSVSIDEDSTAGILIDITATDAESKPGIAITRLPTKGDLYEVNLDGTTGRKIERTYELYDVGSVSTQYVTSVTGVSSFWGGKYLSHLCVWGFHFLSTS